MKIRVKPAKGKRNYRVQTCFQPEFGLDLDLEFRVESILGQLPFTFYFLKSDPDHFLEYRRNQKSY